MHGNHSVSSASENIENEADLPAEEKMNVDLKRRRILASRVPQDTLLIQRGAKNGIAVER